MRRFMVLFAALALLVALGAPAAVAGSPEATTIASHMTFNNPPEVPNTGSFEATGSSLVCGSGTVVDLDYVFGTGQTLVRKEFTCADGSGSFYVKLDVRPTGDETESFTWVIQGGTGDYESLRGHGTGSSVRDENGGGITNSYEGFVNR